MANGKTILPPVKDYFRGHLIPEFPDSVFDVSVEEASVVASVLVFSVADEELFELVFDWLLPWLLVDPADGDAAARIDLKKASQQVTGL